MVRTRVSAALVVSTALAAGVLGAAPVSAGGSQPYLPPAYEMTGETAPNSIAAVGGHLFVADSNAVAVYAENGTFVKSISGVFGARAVVAAPDGSAVYVAESTSGQIAVIDPALLAKAAEIPIKPCEVGDLALVGQFLYYSYSCGSSGEINHVDLATGDAQDLASPDVTGMGVAPRLTADGERLIALDQDGSLSSWAVDAGTGALGDKRTGDAGFQTWGDIAAGQGRLAITTMSGYKFQMFNASTLAKIADLPAAAYPVSVGIAPDGTIVGSTNFGNDNLNQTNSFWFYDPATADLLRTSPQPGGWGEYTEIPGGVAFNEAGTVVYTLASTYQSGYYIVASSVKAPSSRTVSVSAAGPTRYGLPTRFTVRGTPGSTARLTITSWNANDITVTVPIGATGSATYSRVMTHHGSVSAQVGGDLSHSGYASGTASFRVPSAMSVVQSKPLKTVRGILVYKKAKAAKQLVTLRPGDSARGVVVTLYRQKKGKAAWVRVQTGTLYTDGYGRVYTYMAAMVRGYTYRVAYVFRGDSGNTGSGVTTKPFRLK
jgi:YVTN family beta-propeller protein